MGLARKQLFRTSPARSAACRCPMRGKSPPGGIAGMADGDYTPIVTFNDDVMGENIKFMTMRMALGETRLIGNIERAPWNACA